MTGRTATGRELPGEGLVNARDLGGLATASGHVRSGRLFRSASPALATPGDLRALADLGVRRIVDLRTENEVDRDGRPSVAGTGIRWDHRPLSVPGRFLGGAGGVPSAHTYAAEYLKLAPLAVPVVIELLTAAAADEPTMFACTTGKDRTGVVAALVLALLGVCRAEITADYLRTGPALDGRHTAFASLIERKGISVADFAARMRPTADALATLLDTVEADFGSVAEWAVAHGIAAALIADAIAAAVVAEAVGSPR